MEGKPPLRAYWAKAHVLDDPLAGAKYVAPLAHIVGNAVADYLANRGAQLAAIDGVTAKEVLNKFAVVQRLQKRLLYVVHRDLEPRERGDKPEVGLHLSPMANRLASPHVLVDPAVPFCLQCGWGPKGGALNKVVDGSLCWLHEISPPEVCSCCLIFACAGVRSGEWCAHP